jgi:hypothetical protein
MDHVDVSEHDNKPPPQTKLHLDPAAFAWSVAELLGDKFQGGDVEREDLWTEPSSWRTSRSSGSDWLGTPRTQAQVALAEQRKEIFDDEATGALEVTPRRRAELYEDDEHIADEYLQRETEYHQLKMEQQAAADATRTEQGAKLARLVETGERDLSEQVEQEERRLRKEQKKAIKAEQKLEKREAKLRKKAERDAAAEHSHLQEQPLDVPPKPMAAEPKKLLPGYAGSKYMKLRRQAVKLATTRTEQRRKEEKKRVKQGGLEPVPEESSAMAALGPMRIVPSVLGGAPLVIPATLHPDGQGQLAATAAEQVQVHG